MTVIFNWGYWIDSEIPTYGAVSMNSVEWIDDEIASGIDISYEEALQYELAQQIAAWVEDYDGAEFDPINNADHAELVETWSYEFGDMYDNGGESEYLIGAWLIDENGKYAPDHNGEFAAIALCGANIVIVEWSKFVTRCALCSPCYPNSGDLDSMGDFLAYDLPMDLYGEYRQNENEPFEYIIRPDLEITEWSRFTGEDGQ